MWLSVTWLYFEWKNSNEPPVKRLKIKKKEEEDVSIGENVLLTFEHDISVDNIFYTLIVFLFKCDIFADNIFYTLLSMMVLV